KVRPFGTGGSGRQAEERHAREEECGRDSGIHALLKARDVPSSSGSVSLVSREDVRTRLYNCAKWCTHATAQLLRAVRPHLRGRGSRYAAMRLMSFRREMPRIAAARVWLPLAVASACTI